MNYLKIILTLSLLISSLYGVGQNCIDISKKTEKLLQKAKFERNNQNKVAILNKVLSKNPNQSAIYFALGELYTELGNQSLRTQSSPSEGEQILKKAAFYYQSSIQKCKSYHPKSYYNLGNILFSLGKDKEALFCYKSFVEFEEKYPKQIKGNYQTQKINALKIIDGLEFDKNMKENPVPFSPSMVNRISTPLDEYFPMISPDNDLLFYTRKIDRTRLGDIATNVVEEFTISEKEGSSNTFSIGKPVASPFNDGTFNNYGSATLSVDNREMIICACKKERVYRQNYLNCDLYVSKFKRTGKGGNDFEWSPLVNLGENINTKDGWEAQPSLSSDGKTLFFTSIRKGSRDNDIYISEKQSNGTWGLAKPFDEINTAGKDKSPFFHQDGETLYFVSSSGKERKGMGGLDIFYVRRQGDGWSAPKNIGYPINSPQDELGIFVSTSGRIAYFSSLQDGNWNIYAFNLYKEARPEEVVIIKGTLASSEGKTVKNAKVRIHYDDTAESQEITVNDDDGTYAAVVKVNKSKNITIVAQKENATFAISKLDLFPLQTIDTKNVDLHMEMASNTDSIGVENDQESFKNPITTDEIISDSNQVQQIEKAAEHFPKALLSDQELEATRPLNDSKPINLLPIIIDTVVSGSKFELNDVLFESDSYLLKEESKAILNLFAAYILQNENYFIKIEGHTDDIGEAQSNLLLSKKRAEEVKFYLISKGINTKRLAAKGFGESAPKVPNNSASNRVKNRRTECQIIIK